MQNARRPAHYCQFETRKIHSSPWAKRDCTSFFLSAFDLAANRFFFAIVIRVDSLLSPYFIYLFILCIYVVRDENAGETATQLSGHSRRAEDTEKGGENINRLQYYEMRRSITYCHTKPLKPVK